MEDPISFDIYGIIIQSERQRAVKQISNYYIYPKELAIRIAANKFYTLTSNSKEHFHL